MIKATKDKKVVAKKIKQLKKQQKPILYNKQKTLENQEFFVLFNQSILMIPLVFSCRFKCILSPDK